MGAGKSTVGKALAKHLSWDFLDTDHLIEHQTGVSIPTIFEIEGEDGFRKRETQVLKSLAGRSHFVLATGGGIVVRPENHELLKRLGAVIHLSASVNDLYNRTKLDKNRPLLKTPNPRRRIEELTAQRGPLYHQVADVSLETGRQSVSQLVQRICNSVGVAPIDLPDTLPSNTQDAGNS